MTKFEAIQKLAENPQDADALLGLYDEVRDLIRSTVSVHIGSEGEQACNAHYLLLYRIAGRAAYYDPDDPLTNLDEWLIGTADTECIRIQNERRLVAQ